MFSWSYLHLDAGAARAFRLIGAASRCRASTYAAAALTGRTLAVTGQLLDRLAASTWPADRARPLPHARPAADLRP